MRVDADRVSVQIDNTPIVLDATISVASGSFVGIIGPNGSGKTTLLKSLHRALRPVQGSIAVGGADLWRLSAQESARRSSVVLQDDASEFAFTVRETVETGRVPHKRLFERHTTTDSDAVDHALETAGVAHLTHRLVGTLSGGERQRVFVARALAQCTPVMVLDEPTNHLDVSAQIDLLELLTSLPLTVIAALHDLNLAAAYCDELYVMAAGRVITHGPPSVVLTSATIHDVYGVAAHCCVNPLTGRPLIAFGPARPASPISDPPIRSTHEKAEQ
ncbi:ABC transporter ATP-binding protein [Agreia pratensis]|uniref:ABC transporter ATP-binding protein n=1 Tax=Agreia pratensis TaxID=150121 RepID=UPI00188A9D0B|nr:ABC transporter ATP-binding protein [Agreia pratensis]MBF4635325.1 ABC transporter ATP-binding protein [Agreia pratensis]